MEGARRTKNPNNNSEPYLRNAFQDYTRDDLFNKNFDDNINQQKESEKKKKRKKKKPKKG